MEHFRVRTLTELDSNSIVKAAGGCRAHLDADARDRPGADYLLGEAVLELKSLNDEGLAKPERQAKLAALFRSCQPERPVIVLDRFALPVASRCEYDRILETPIKTAISKANKQLKQSRAEHPSATASILVVINNGYTALNHNDLVRMTAHRVRQDTSEIDGVVVGGCYFHSDTYDSYFLWPIDYVPVNIGRPFESYERLRSAWNDFADDFMTQVVLGKIPPDKVRGPVIDTQFDVDGIAYVKPAPPMGSKSEFFRHGRPRKDSSGLEHCPIVACTFPDMTREEWLRFRASIPLSDWDCRTFEDWMRERAEHAALSQPLKPFVPMLVTHDDWVKWAASTEERPTIGSVARYAKELFELQVRALFATSRERISSGLVPARYVLVVTEVIGQDRANDVSHIAVVREQPYGEPVILEVVANARIFHEHALMLGCAYALSKGVEVVLWQKHLEYAW